MMSIGRSASRLGAAALITCALAAAAHAYSVAAVRDARTLVSVTINKSLAGIASQTDVAIAQYNLLAMEYQARLISHADYCRSAQPFLKIVAATLDTAQYRQTGEAGASPDGQSAKSKKSWQEAVAAMAGSPSACDAAVTMTEQLLFGETDAAAPSAVETAKAAVEKLRGAYSAGTASEPELAQAQLDLFYAQYRARELSRTDYCQSGLKVAAAMETILKNREMWGQVDSRTLPEVITARRRIFQVRALCNAG